MLTQHGIPHEACDPGLDDGKLSPGPNVLPEEWVAALAYLKAVSAIERYGDLWNSGPRENGRTIPDVVIGADTIVVHDGAIIGQPRDADDARRIIQRLADCEHTVLTGVALVRPSTRAREIFHDTATVRVGSIAAPKIDQYIASGLWRGKAGAYNLAERLQAGWDITFDGDPTTIMGLPMAMLTRRLGAYVTN